MLHATYMQHKLCTLLSERHRYLELRSVLPTTHKGWYAVSTYRHCEETTDEA